MLLSCIHALCNNHHDKKGFWYKFVDEKVARVVIDPVRVGALYTKSSLLLSVYTYSISNTVCYNKCCCSTAALIHARAAPISYQDAAARLHHRLGYILRG